MKLCPRALLVILLGALFLGAGGPEAATLPQSPTTLPSCPAIGLQAISPFFDQDQTLFASTGDGILWRSTDGDATWQAVYQVPTGTDDFFIQGLLIAPVASDEGLHLYLKVGKHWFLNIFYYRTYSPDGGATWEALWSDATVTCWQATTNQNGTLFASCVTFPRNPPEPDGIHRSTDHGHTWQHVWTESGALQIAPSPDYVNDQTVFAIRSGPNPMISTDGGLTWGDLSSGVCPPGEGSNIKKIVVSPDFPNDEALFGITTARHLLKSIDGGISWQHLYPEDEDPCQYSSDPVWEVALSPDYASDQTIFMRADSGLYVSYDDGRHWRQLLGSRQVSNIQIRRRPAAAYRPLYLPLLLRGVAAGTAPPHRAFLPLLIGSGTLPHSAPLTLFVQKRGEYAYVRSRRRRHHLALRQPAAVEFVEHYNELRQKRIRRRTPMKRILPTSLPPCGIIAIRSIHSGRRPPGSSSSLGSFPGEIDHASIECFAYCLAPDGSSAAGAARCWLRTGVACARDLDAVSH